MDLELSLRTPSLVNRHRMPRSVTLAKAAVALSTAPLLAHATGFDLPDQDAFAGGRGMAFVATANNASAIYYNPAGLTQLRGHHLRPGIYTINLETDFDSPAGHSSETLHNSHAVPHFFYAYGAETVPLSAGLGVYTPFGLSTEWPNDSGFRTVATRGRLTYLTLNPAVAWQVFPSLSAGAGLTVNYVDVHLQRGLFWPSQSFDNFGFQGTGWDVGYNLGLRWQPHPKLAFGATFRSTTTVDLDGHTDFRNDVAMPLPDGTSIPAFPKQKRDAEAEFPFPLKTIVGVSYRPTPAWNLEFNADYTDWSRLGTIVVHQESAFPPLLGEELPLVLKWESSWIYEFGATRYFGNGWSVSAGYIFNENSVPDANYTPLVADLDRHFFSAGTGYQGRRFGFDAAYQFGYGPTRTVSGSAPSAIGQTADGNYDFISHAVFLTGNVRF